MIGKVGDVASHLCILRGVGIIIIIKSFPLITIIIKIIILIITSVIMTHDMRKRTLSCGGGGFAGQLSETAVLQTFNNADDH